VDSLEFLLKLVELDENVRNQLITLAGGPAALAVFIATKLDLQIRPEDAAKAFGLSQSGTRKRLRKIKGKKTPKIDPESVQNVPKASRKHPFGKKMK
jgi:hypothetical protein